MFNPSTLSRDQYPKGQNVLLEYSRVRSNRSDVSESISNVFGGAMEGTDTYVNSWITVVACDQSGQPTVWPISAHVLDWKGLPCPKIGGWQNTMRGIATARFVYASVLPPSFLFVVHTFAESSLSTTNKSKMWTPGPPLPWLSSSSDMVPTLPVGRRGLLPSLPTIGGLPGGVLGGVFPVLALRWLPLSNNVFPSKFSPALVYVSLRRHRGNKKTFYGTVTLYNSKQFNYMVFSR